MASLKEYDVEINGITHTMQLNDDDAKRYGKAAVPAKKSTPKNKAATPPNTGAGAENK